MELERCGWARLDPLYIRYHDEEWGVPLRENDNALFERVCLEGAQAGLSWITVLRKREHYRAAFKGFDPDIVAAFDEAKQAELLLNPNLIRNRLKIRSAVQNARAFLKVQAEFGTFDHYLWGYVNGMPIQNVWASLAEVPAETPLSRQISKNLKARGFTFVGPTIVYAMMQAIGMVNDHVVTCFRHMEIARLGEG